MNHVEKERVWHTQKRSLASGSGKISYKIKPDYISIKRIQNMRLDKTKPSITGSYFIQKFHFKIP